MQYLTKEQIDKILENVSGSARSGSKESKEKQSLLEDIRKKLVEGQPVRQHGIQHDRLKEFNFLTEKPVLYVANVGDAYCNKCKTWMKID